MFKAGCFLCDEHGPRRGHRDFHWSRPAVLDPALPTYEHVRDRVWRFVTGTLSEKLREHGLDGSMHVGFVAELLCGADPSPTDMVRVAAVARAAQTGPAVAATPCPPVGSPVRIIRGPSRFGRARPVAAPEPVVPSGIEEE